MSEIIITPFKLEDIKLLLKADVFLIANENYAVRHAANFTYEEIAEAREITNKLNKKLFISVNKLFEDQELVSLIGYLKYLKTLNVDGIYFADLAVLEICEQLGIHNKLIYNPDTLITNHFDSNFFNDKGIQAVTISKEASLSDIQAIAKLKNGKRELIAHGYLHMLYSKRKLLSNHFDFHSKENNLSANYTIQEISRNECYPILEDSNSTSIFTGQILCLIEQIAELQELGIDFFRIDGIFMDTNYLIEILDLYDKTLKGAKITLNQIAEKFTNHQYSTGLLYKKVTL